MTDPLKTRLNILNVKLEKALQRRKGPRIPGDGDGDGIPNEGRKKGTGAAAKPAAARQDSEAAALAQRPQLVAAYRAAAKNSSEKGQKALDAASPALESKDPKAVKSAIAAVAEGLKAHRASYEAALAIPYPGNSSPWSHHKERVGALTELKAKLEQRLSTLAGKK